MTDYSELIYQDVRYLRGILTNMESMMEEDILSNKTSYFDYFLEGVFFALGACCICVPVFFLFII